MQWLLLTAILSGFLQAAVDARAGSYSSIPPLSSPRLKTPLEEVLAARNLLAALLGPGGWDSLDLLAPPDKDPCQSDLSAPVIGSAVYPIPGFCGPFVSSSDTAKWKMEVNVSCAWAWLSCVNWRIIAVNLSCSLGAGAAPLFRGAVQLRGAFPAGGLDLPKLVSLDLSGNRMLGGPLNLSGWEPMMELQTLRLSYCNWSGQLPGDWSAVPMLTTLDLGGNALSGPLPANLSGLSGLKQLYLGDNAGLSGFLPMDWGEKMGRLQILDVTGACRLCGSSTMFPKLQIALTSGSHVNLRCRPEECDGGWRGLHSVFQGVMAAFASVLGLTALVLVLRRVRDCTNARAAAAAAAAAGRGSSRLGRTASGDAASVDGRGGQSRGSRRQRSHRRRPPGGGPLHAVPLYTCEVDADGGVKWSVVLVGPGGGGGSRSRRRQSAEQQQQQEQPGAAEGDQQQQQQRAAEQGGRWQGGEGDSAREAERRLANGDGAAGTVELAAVPAGAAERAMLPSRPEADGEERGAADGRVGRRGAQSAGGAAAAGAARSAAGGELPPPPVSTPGAAGRQAADGSESLGARAGSSAEAGTEAGTGPPRTPRRGGGSRSSCSARRLPHPPDAVIVMPDGLEVCLGRRLSQCDDGGATVAGSDAAAPGCCAAASLPRAAEGADEEAPPLSSPAAAAAAAGEGCNSSWGAAGEMGGGGTPARRMDGGDGNVSGGGGTQRRGGNQFAGVMEAEAAPLRSPRGARARGYEDLPARPPE